MVTGKKGAGSMLAERLYLAAVTLCFVAVAVLAQVLAVH